MISYKDALYDWVEANEDTLREDYKAKYGEYPNEDNEKCWLAFQQESFDDMLAMVPEPDR